jgi:ABC-2 type transport system ATP-binding protein
MKMNLAILAENLVRCYGKKRAVAGLNLQVPKGSIFGLIGENGCGKTTTINLLMGNIAPHDGYARVMGELPMDMPLDVRSRIGFLGDEAAVPDRMVLSDAMEIHGSFFPVWDKEKSLSMLEEFGVNQYATYGNLSKGEKRWFMLSLVISQHPGLLMMDEPAGGLDVSVRRRLMEIILEECSETGMTVLITSHILTDLERVIDHIGLMKKGKILMQDELDAVKDRTWKISIPGKNDPEPFRKSFTVLGESEEKDSLEIIVTDYKKESMPDASILNAQPLNLEEIFIAWNRFYKHKENSRG